MRELALIPVCAGAVAEELVADSIRVAASLASPIAAGIAGSPAVVGRAARISRIATSGGAAPLRGSAGALGFSARSTGGFSIGSGQGVGVFVLFLNGEGRGPFIDSTVAPASYLGGPQLLLVVRKDDATRAGV